MARLSSKLRDFKGEGFAGIMHWCPGCKCCHVIYIENRPGAPKWTWNGSVDRPTCGPSVRCFTTPHKDGKPVPGAAEITLCHYFLKDGQIEFCGDSPHEFGGKTVPLPDIPDDYGGGED